MIRLLFSTLRWAMSCQLDQSLGRALALFGFEGKYWFVGDQSASEGILIAISLQSFAHSGWINPDQLVRAGGAG